MIDHCEKDGQSPDNKLKSAAEKRGIKGYDGMSRTELVKALRDNRTESTQTPPSKIDRPTSHTTISRPPTTQNPTNILDQPVPEVNVPILRPSRPPRNSHVQSLKHIANKVVKPVKDKINKFADWILSYVPKPIKKEVNKKVKDLKEKVNRIFSRLERFTPKERQTALKGSLKTFRVDGQKGLDPQTFITNIKPKVIDLINQQKKPIKTKFIFTCKFIKENPATSQIDENSGYFHTNVEVVTAATDFSTLFTVMVTRLLELVEQFQNNGSGWQFDQVEYFDIHIDPYKPLSGSSYVLLPPVLASKKAIINVKNEKDHECFKWAVTSAVYPKEKDPQRLTKRMRENSGNFDWTGIKFPVSLKQVETTM